MNPTGTGGRGRDRGGGSQRRRGGTEDQNDVEKFRLPGRDCLHISLKPSEYWTGVSIWLAWASIVGLLGIVCWLWLHKDQETKCGRFGCLETLVWPAIMLGNIMVHKWISLPNPRRLLLVKKEEVCLCVYSLIPFIEMFTLVKVPREGLRVVMEGAEAREMEPHGGKLLVMVKEKPFWMDMCCNGPQRLIAEQWLAEEINREADQEVTNTNSQQ